MNDVAKGKTGCRFCGGIAIALIEVGNDFGEIWQQVEPAGCVDCGAVEIWPTWSPRCTEEEMVMGWFDGEGYPRFAINNMTAGQWEIDFYLRQQPWGYKSPRPDDGFAEFTGLF